MVDGWWVSTPFRPPYPRRIDRVGEGRRSSFYHVCAFLWASQRAPPFGLVLRVRELGPRGNPLGRQPTLGLVEPSMGGLSVCILVPTGM